MTATSMLADDHSPNDGKSPVACTPWKETSSQKAPWFQSSIGARLTPYMQHLFERYVGIPKDEIVTHIDQIREKAWKILPYPCVGSYGFIVTQLEKSPHLSTVVHRIQQGATFLELGACFGQELRILADAGAPTKNMFALDRTPEFWELSFELFRDREKMDAPFVQADFMSDSCFEEVAGLRELVGKTDIIHAGYFFHLFGWDGHLEAMVKVVKLSRVGTTLIGHQIGRTTAAEESTTSEDGELKKLFHHSEESWKALWKEVQERTKTEWKVEVECIGLKEFGLQEEDYNWMPPTARALTFFVTRL